VNSKRVIDKRAHRTHGSRRARAAQGQLEAAPCGWCDACQLGDAMFTAFVEALKARFAHCAADIDARARVQFGKTLAALDAGHGALDVRADTGLRVMGTPIWRYQGSGVCVCEALAGDHVILTYEPGAPTRRVPLNQQETSL
jgi:hypothetical protein